MKDGLKAIISVFIVLPLMVAAFIIALAACVAGFAAFAVWLLGIIIFEIA